MGEEKEVEEEGKLIKLGKEEVAGEEGEAGEAWGLQGFQPMSQAAMAAPLISTSSAPSSHYNYIL